MQRILTIVGARPQFIKAAAVSRVIESRSDVEEAILDTGQHYDENLSDVFFRELEIPHPLYSLSTGSASHGKQTALMLTGIEDVLLENSPDMVLVYGDTNSTLAGALAAVKLHIPVAHVEAGLRSFNRKMPEEHNRVLTDHLSDLLFAPTVAAVANLEREGLAGQRMIQCGDVMCDVARFFAAKVEKTSRVLETLDLTSKAYVLATIHRAENTDDPVRLKNIAAALIGLAESCPLLLPIHPRTKAALVKYDLYDLIANRLKVIEPVGYLDMVMLEKHARLIVTDSGGVQKEAYFQGTPCVTLRDETEWVELLETGWNRLASPLSPDELHIRLAEGMNAKPVPNRGLYGDGYSAHRIVEELVRFMKK